jgi:hypothetical protein
MVLTTEVPQYELRSMYTFHLFLITITQRKFESHFNSNKSQPLLPCTEMGKRKRFITT